ncbi:MAG: protein translocase subunit SecF [Candidatus Cloacimonetes bacterium]|nr:protein translocase subunit SecF [Candidatus Cloacimonadota bacterium]
MKFFGETKIDFIGKRKTAFSMSAFVIIIGIIFMFISGLKYSIDFTGGLSLELEMTPNTESDAVISIEEIRQALKDDGITDAEIQELHDMEGRRLILIKTQVTGEEETQTGFTKGDQIVNSLKAKFPNNYNPATFVRQQDEVGPRIGEELKGKAVLAIFWALMGIIIYIWWRFEFTFGIAAIAALIHDILITVGIFAIFGKEISLPVVAALLTIVGYSLNDTIVVFDRIREDIKKFRKQSYAEIINHSINETLSRTIITSLTTFLVVLCLYIFGGSVINDFAFALLIGVVVGTYSSIFIASPILVGYFNKRHSARKRK